MTTHSEPMHPELVTRILHLPMTSDPDAFRMTSLASERIVVEISSPDANRRGHLDEFVVAAIDAELSRRGSAPAGWMTSDSLEAKLDDQLYRARLLGAGGLALRFDSLSSIADIDGQLCADDSATVRRLLTVAEHERLQLFLPHATAALRVLGAPRQLSDLLPAASREGRVALIEHEPIGYGESVAAAAPRGSASQENGATAPLGGAVLQLAEPAIEAFSSAPSEVARELSDRADASTTAAGSGGDAPADEGDRAPRSGADGGDPASMERASDDARAASSDASLARAWSAERAQRCAAWAAQLRGMNGPKVHGSVEKAFVTAYLPLRREIAAGNAPEDMRAALEIWAEGFAQSYASAFRSLASRTKRPRMVRDVIELGIAWLNQSRARQCQLLMVDGMRFDLGQLLNERLERDLAGSAVCVDHTLLWAALPSNAESQQLGVQRAIRRGPERRSDDASDPGRIETLRAGTRELFRLDHIGRDLTKPGEVEAQRLERLAESLARVVVPWMRAQPPETLVIVFGDHGFHWQASPTGTSPASQGGALPEQVLTPASGWLLGHRQRDARVAPGLH